jgi:branched-chain amino acid transport system substrate-binding protein
MEGIKKFFIYLSMFFMIVGISFVSSTVSAETKKIFKFSNATPTSGPYAAWGWPIIYSLEIAVNDVNAAGGIKVGGEYYKMEMVSYDNAGDPTVSSTVTRKAIYDQKTKYLFITTTDEGAAVNDFTNEMKAVMFNDGPYRDYIGPKAPFSFQCWYDFVDMEEPIFKYIKEKYPQFTRVAVMASDDVRGQIAANDFKELALTLGFNIVDTIFTPAGHTDFYSTLTALLQKKVDIINVSSSGFTDQGYIIKQARELGYKGLFVHPDTLDTKTLAEITGMKALEGNIGGPQMVEMKTDLGKKWATRFTERYGTAAWWPSLKYDTVLLLKAAIEKANSFDTEKVLKALGEVSVQGCSGKTSFKKTKFTGGLPRTLNIPMHFIQIQNGKEVDIW